MKKSYFGNRAIVHLAHLDCDQGRYWMATEPMEIELSDGHWITIPRGFRTDLRSSPSWLWWLVRPYNKALLAYIIHDYLYTNKLQEMNRHYVEGERFKPYLVRKFADQEMYKWAIRIAPKKKIDALASYWAVRIFGAGVYWGRRNI